MTSADAELLAIRALGFIAGEERLMAAFLGETGLELHAVRGLAQDPAFLGGVLDFLLAREDRVVWFCRAEEVPAEAPMRARAHLPGGIVE